MIRFNITSLILISLTSGLHAHISEPSNPFDILHAHESLEGHIHAGWDTHYFSEGRDALDGDSLAMAGFEFGWKHLFGGVWYGSSPQQRYDEMQLSLGLVQEVGDFEFYAAYTHFLFPFEDTHDDEIGAGITWAGLPCEFELALDAYYSFDAEGTFIELALAREFAITERLALFGSCVFGMNQGYVSDGHDGANHIALQAGISYAVCENILLTSHGTYSWALDRDPTAPGDGLLRDFFHYGFGVEYSF